MMLLTEHLHARIDAMRVLGVELPDYSLDAVVLRHALPERQGAARPSGIRRGPVGRCFENSARLAQNRPDLTYCEGYAASSRIGIPIHHAWVIDSAGTVIDITWADPESCSYLGIPFAAADLSRHMLKTGVYGLLDTGRGLNLDLFHELDSDLPTADADADAAEYRREMASA